MRSYHHRAWAGCSITSTGMTGSATARMSSSVMRLLPLHLGDFQERFSSCLRPLLSWLPPRAWGVDLPPAGGGQVGGGSNGEEAWGRMPSTRFPPPTSPRWGEARVLATLPWTTTRDVLFRNRLRAGLSPLLRRYGYAGGKCRVHGLYCGQSWVLASALHLCAGALSCAHHRPR